MFIIDQYYIKWFTISNKIRVWVGRETEKWKYPTATKQEVHPSKYFELPTNKEFFADLDAKSTEVYKYYIITGQR